MQGKKRIAIVAHLGMEFYNARIPLVQYLTQQGYEVFAIVPDDEYFSKIKNTGIQTLSYTLKNNSLNPIASWASIKQIRRYCKEYKFHIIHSFSLQPNIYTGFACLFNKKIKIINHITGLGYAFTTSKLKPLLYRLLILLLYQFLDLFTCKVIVQNVDDKKILSKLIGVKRKVEIVKGSGVNSELFSLRTVDKDSLTNIRKEFNLQASDIICTFVGRLVFEKGIRELLESAINISKTNQSIKFLIIGWIDSHNPSCISQEYIDDLKSYSNIIFLGKRNDIKNILAITNIFVLPTYREGFPRSVLEAMSMGLPIISTDVPGVREAIKQNLNGILVPVKNVEKLSNAISLLASNYSEQIRMGKEGRKLVEQELDSKIIFERIAQIYDICLQKNN
jgi:N,N'-diacetylbacillosaminyl-diphospho-undecaprenol alpha-1,3-N-acetylgalactosaminyltransferase